jgi:transcriptional regulator with XRE-family HTH domain
VCDDPYGGTREGFILVEELTVKTAAATRAATRPSAASAANGSRRREELADFLRKRRASLLPEDVGLPNGGRRRTPGLRREEVAQLAGVGTTWYTWLEQGRDVRASLEVLEALARGLRLTPAERVHLILLGRGEEAPERAAPPERVSPTLRRLIANLGPAPAFLLGRRWDYLAWNPAACAVFGDLAKVPRPQRNHIWLGAGLAPGRREVPRRQRAAPRRPGVRGAHPRAAVVQPRVLSRVEAPRGRASRRGPQGAAPPRGRHARLRARGVPPGRQLRAAAHPLHARGRARHGGEAGRPAVKHLCPAIAPASLRCDRHGVSSPGPTRRRTPWDELAWLGASLWPVSEIGFNGPGTEAGAATAAVGSLIVIASLAAEYALRGR